MIGDRIKRERKARDWRIKDLAERSGISEGYLRLLETNRRPNPTSDTLTALAGAFGVPIDDLLQEVGPDPNQPPIELLKAAGLWTEAEERALRRAWPVLSPRRRTLQIARLQRLAATRAEYDRLYAEYQRSQQDEGTGANGVAPAVHVLGAL
jgi:transcriptional regulator with XRE-family HTH domain